MAAVTVNSQRTNVCGSYREKFFNVTGASTNTLATGLRDIRAVSYSDGTITKAAVSGSTVTFTSTGAFTGTLVRVLGH